MKDLYLPNSNNGCCHFFFKVATFSQSWGNLVLGSWTFTFKVSFSILFCFLSLFSPPYPDISGVFIRFQVRIFMDLIKDGSLFIKTWPSDQNERVLGMFYSYELCTYVGFTMVIFTTWFWRFWCFSQTWRPRSLFLAFWS